MEIQVSKPTTEKQHHRDQVYWRVAIMHDMLTHLAFLPLYLDHAPRGTSELERWRRQELHEREVERLDCALRDVALAGIELDGRLALAPPGTLDEQVEQFLQRARTVEELFVIHLLEHADWTAA